MTIGFVGLSHLGIVSSAAWAARGHSVVAVDPDPSTVARLRAGDPVVHEPRLRELLASVRGRLDYSEDPAVLRGCDVVIVARDVPTDGTGRSDEDAVTRLVDVVIPQLRSSVVLVVMSQVRPGYTRALGRRVRSIRKDLRLVLHYLVETLVLGNAVERATRPDRAIVGCEAGVHVAPILRESLERFDCPILAMSLESAELCKAAINLYLIGSVTYANTMADVCERVGADWSQIVPALRLDPRIGPKAYLRPGLGLSGGNLERDLAGVRSVAHGMDTGYLDALIAHNERRIEWVQRIIDDICAKRDGARLAVWGLAYKPDTGYLKNAPSLKVIRAIGDRATVQAWDPAVDRSEVERAVGPGARLIFAETPEEAARDADCVVVLTAWPQVASADMDRVRSVMRTPRVVDCAGALAEEALNGFDVRRMGRTAST